MKKRKRGANYRSAQEYAMAHMGDRGDGTRSKLRAKILDENAIPYICAICGIEPYWHDRPLTLTLDHKDGDSGNHGFDNLRFVCPNCDSQQNTYCSRNRGKYTGAQRSAS